MEQTGFLHVLIGIFTAIGSLFTGGRGAPQEVAAPPAQVAVITLDVDSSATTDEELDAAIATLESRFPGAEVTARAATAETKRRIVIDGAVDSGDESLEELATSIGGFQMLMTASSEDASELSVDLAEERARVTAFLAADSKCSLEDYNALTPENGGSPERLVFGMEGTDSGFVPVALCVESQETWRFDQDALDRSFASFDMNGRHALGFDVTPSRQTHFEAFTTQHEGEQMALLVGTRIITRPNLNSPLRSGGIITGGANGFTLEEVQSLSALMSAPKLKAKLTLRSIGRRDR